MRKRDVTLRRILEAATVEFAAQGFAGARVDRIARRARVNKRMLYYYFGSKRRLFGEVLAAAARRRLDAVPSTAQSPVDVAVAWYRHACEHPELVRLLLWQALEGPPTSASGDDKRSPSVDRLRTLIFGALKSGRLSPAFDVNVLLLALIALSVFPIGFPHVTSTITGLLPRDRRFQRAHAELLGRLFESW